MREVNRVWLEMLSLLMLRNNVHRNQRTGSDITELLGYQTRVPMSESLLTVEGRKLGYRFAPAEAWWILSGDNRVETIAPYSKQISQFSDDGVFFRGAYGPQLVDQLPYVVNTLADDFTTRQAVATVWRQRPGPSKDIPCTVSLQFLIRDNKLHCNATMRSSDAWLGWPYDVFNFSMISGYVALLLRKVCQDVWEVGDLILTAGSQHLYEVNWKGAEACLADPVEKGFSTLEFDWNKFDEPGDLLLHLKAVADRNPYAMKNNWLRDLGSPLPKFSSFLKDMTTVPR